jgi:hypothetical protein
VALAQPGFVFRVQAEAGFPRRPLLCWAALLQLGQQPQMPASPWEESMVQIFHWVLASSSVC